MAEDPLAGSESKEGCSPDEAIKILLEGNKRFESGKCEHPHESIKWREHLEAEQHPVAVVVGCSDSRVSPELIFDRGLGDIFAVRVAGNIIDTDVTASVEYAVDHLNTQLVVVLGHSGCGAVTAALDHASESSAEPDEVVSLLYRIEPALQNIPKNLSRDERIKRAVRKNVEQAVRRLSLVPDMMKNLKSNRVVIIGAVYDMHQGRVEFISRTDSKGHRLLKNKKESRAGIDSLINESDSQGDPGGS